MPTGERRGGGATPTLRSIAKEVGVTANTVSLALKDSPLVAAPTKARILGAARSMGYVPNAVAGSLRSGRSNTIAIIVGDVSNLLFALKIKSLERILREKRYQVMILNTEENPALEYQAIKTAIGRKADGVVICPCQQSTGGLELMRQYGVPCVLMGRHYGEGSYDSVVWDDRAGGYIATDSLIRQGCRRIMQLSAPMYISSARERRDGYEQALRDRGIEIDPALMFDVSPVSGSTTELLERLGDGADYDGIFAFSDLMGLEAARWLWMHGRERVRLVGFDDILAHIMMPFALSSVGASIDGETGAVVKLLLDRIGGLDASPALVRIPVYLAERDEG